MGIKRVAGIGIGIFLMLLVDCSAKADSFAFSLRGPTVSGNGTFITSPLETSPANCPEPPAPGMCYFITGMTGQIGGQDITNIIILTSVLGEITPSLELDTISAVGIIAGSENCTGPAGITECVPAAGSMFWGLHCTLGGYQPCAPNQDELFGIQSYDPHIFGDYASNGFSEPVTLSITPVPEPSTVLLLGIGLLCLWSLRYWKAGALKHFFWLETSRYCHAENLKNPSLVWRC